LPTIENINLTYPLDVLAKKLGLHQLIEVLDELGGQSVYIPTKSFVLKDYTKSQIKRDYQKGMTYQELKNKYRLSDRQIRYICNDK